MNLTRRQFFASTSALVAAVVVPSSIFPLAPTFREAILTSAKFRGVDLSGAPAKPWHVDPTALYLGKAHNNGRSWGKAAVSLADIADQIGPNDTVYIAHAEFDGEITVPPCEQIIFYGCKFTDGVMVNAVRVAFPPS